MKDADISAFLRFADNFDCLDSESWTEAQEKILISIQSVSDELESAFDEAESRNILQSRFKKFYSYKQE